MKARNVEDRMKKCMVMVIASALILTGCSTHPGISDEDWEAAQQQAQEEYENASEELEAKTATEASTEATTQSVTSEVTEETTEEVETTEVAETEEETKEVSSGSHEIGDVTIFFTKHVNNDVTGNWRVATTTTAKSAEEYAAEYYKECFASDDEIHGICNLGLKTTARITVLDSDTLDVTIMEYQDGEEHDAKELFGGMTLAEYHVSISSGAAEKIE